MHPSLVLTGGLVRKIRQYNEYNTMNRIHISFINLTLNIANSAHISGLFFGALFARLHYFDRQKK